MNLEPSAVRSTQESPGIRAVPDDDCPVIRAVGQQGVPPRIDSKAIKSRVEAALQSRADDDARQILVAVEGDKVILTGKVRSWAVRSALRTAAWSALGVGQVADRLSISY